MTEGVFGRLGVGVIVWGLGDCSGRVRRGPTFRSGCQVGGRAGNPSGGILCRRLRFFSQPIRPPLHASLCHARRL